MQTPAPSPQGHPSCLSGWLLDTCPASGSLEDWGDPPALCAHPCSTWHRGRVEGGPPEEGRTKNEARIGPGRPSFSHVCPHAHTHTGTQTRTHTCVCRHKYDTCVCTWAQDDADHRGTSCQPPSLGPASTEPLTPMLTVSLGLSLSFLDPGGRRPVSPAPCPRVYRGGNTACGSRARVPEPAQRSGHSG